MSVTEISHLVCSAQILPYIVAKNVTGGRGGHEDPMSDCSVTFSGVRTKNMITQKKGVPDITECLKLSNLSFDNPSRFMRLLIGMLGMMSGVKLSVAGWANLLIVEEILETAVKLVIRSRS